MSTSSVPETGHQATPGEDIVRMFIPGTPVPQGSKTAFVVGKRAVVTDQNKTRLRPWRAAIADYADMGRTFDCPVWVRLDFYLPRPIKPRWARPAVKPDVDKLTRAALDGLTDGGLLADDARVVDLTAVKHYGMPLGMWVTVGAA